MNNTYIIGAGGHARTLIPLVQGVADLNLIGLIERKGYGAERCMGFPVFSIDNDFSTLSPAADSAVIGIGQIISPLPRLNIFESLHRKGISTPTIISSSAIVSEFTTLGAGTIIMNYAFVGPEVEIGKNCIVNNRVSLEHGVTVADHCHISTGAILNGDVTIGEKSFVGSGCVIKNGVTIGSGCVISFGEKISENLSDGSLFKDGKVSKLNV